MVLLILGSDPMNIVFNAIHATVKFLPFREAEKVTKPFSGLSDWSKFQCSINYAGILVIGSGPSWLAFSALNTCILELILIKHVLLLPVAHFYFI